MKLKQVPLALGKVENNTTTIFYHKKDEECISF
jgi:hypothetical protein